MTTRDDLVDKATAWDAISAKNAENARLREILCECAAAIGNGAAISPECSLEFMAHLPSEIAASAEKKKNRITDLERQLAEETERCARVAEANMHSSVMPGHVGKNIAAAIRGLRS